ncbi:PQQ-dependent sugar dehydrogenase [Kitasatospora sp. NPDC097691]|uniref:PQQ-dependent sugar dehydrogenase n=1 Tax=Kitasatospora sp. NPDC097691 TaxID=3157231 RepID=UPI003318B813
MRRRLLALLLAALLAPAGCSSAPAPGPASPGSAHVSASASGAASGSASTGPEVRATLAEGLAVPWGVALLPGGDLLVSERDTARIVRVAAGGGAKTEAGVVPGVTAGGEGGLLGLALSPSFADDHLVHAYLSTAEDNRIVRLGYHPERPAGVQLGSPAVLLSGIPHGPRHNGGRIAFGPDGLLYATTGDSSDSGTAQDKGSLGGKILRLTPDGAPAPDNPFPGSPVYSYGHRNVQGLAWDGEGRLWASEFGENTWDELNLIRPGGNYGWPVVEGTGHRPGYLDPVAQWSPAEASPSGLAYAGGALWMAALRGTRLWRVPIAGDRLVGSPQAYLDGVYGRLRTVVTDRDGTLLLATGNTDGRGDPRPGDDRILRLGVPAS